MAEELEADTRAEAQATPAKLYRRWMLEISLAQKREKKWREKAKKAVETYRGENRKKNSFNILWSNTEVLRPALYNSPPKPDVRRRFRQSDALGKAVSEVMERSLSYCVDAYDLDNCLQGDVLDALLPGRGLSRIRYVPKFKRVPTQVEVAQDAPTAAAPEADREEVEYEQALCEHVQWDDFLHGPGKTWEEVQWCGFRHRLCRDDLIEKFGEEIGKKITLNDVADEELKDSSSTESDREAFKRAELWEIWDKDGNKVFFVNESYKEDVLYPVADENAETPEEEKGAPPLRLKNFFPVPRPLVLVEDTGTLVPSPLYELYREQAEELDRLSSRINKIINACRVRFVHDSTLTELRALMDAGDNEGIPAESARAWMTNGGIEKAIWWMPIDKVAAVLRELYVARDACKQVIFEITGMSDILRGATNPNETLGAQELKANSSSLRMERMVSEVQRYTRDLIRLLAEVIGENFDPQTLAQMTGMQFPTAQQKMVVQMQMQAAQRMLAQPGAQPPPEVQQKMAEAQKLLAVPAWEDIMGVLRSDIQREYRVDVETDSTVAQSLTQDMAGMREVYTALVELWTGAGPAVQSGALSIDVVKAMSLSVARRARMGLEVEDAIEQGMKQPPPQADPNAAKAKEAEVAAQAEQAKEAELTKREGQEKMAAAQEKQQQDATDLQREQLESQEKIALDEQAKRAEIAKHEIETREKYAFERWKVEKECEVKVQVADIAADAAVERADANADGGVEGQPKPKRRSKLKELSEGQGRTEASIAQLAEQVGRYLEQQAEESASPVEFERGADGRVGVIRKGAKALRVARGADGKASGLERLQ